MFISGALCCVSSETAFFVLKCDKDAIALYLEQGLSEEDGCEAAFEPIYEVIDVFPKEICSERFNLGKLNKIVFQVAERVSTGRWLGDCFVYVNANDRLNYCVVSGFRMKNVDWCVSLTCCSYGSFTGRRGSNTASFGQENVLTWLHG